MFLCMSWGKQLQILFSLRLGVFPIESGNYVSDCTLPIRIFQILVRYMFTGLYYRIHDYQNLQEVKMKLRFLWPLCLIIVDDGM